MPSRLVDFQTLGGIFQTINADAVTRVMPQPDGTSVIEFIAPQPALAVKEDAENVQAAIANALAEPGVAASNGGGSVPSHEPPALPSDALGG